MRQSALLPVFAFILVLPLSAQTSDRPKAEALVKEGHAFLKTHGKAALVAEVQKASGKFHAKPGNPLYLFVYDLNGVVLAHGAEANLLGVNRLNVKDPDGKQYTKEFVAVGQKKGGGWVEYKRMNPETRQIEHKTSFVLAEDGVVIGCGIYK
ncbi:MAG: cache domain-containing protein [Geothrix sp.]|nr:cache domain-containing protein [Geothrix sp.]